MDPGTSTPPAVIGKERGLSPRLVTAGLAAVAVAALSLPLAHSTHAATTLGDVKISASSAPASVPSGTYFSASFTATNTSASATAGPVTLTDQVVDRPAYIQTLGNFLASHANGAHIDSVTSTGASASCSTLTQGADVNGDIAWAGNPVLGVLFPVLEPIESPINDLLSAGVGGLPGSVVTAAGAELSQPTPGVPNFVPPSLPPPTPNAAVFETAKCVAPTLAAGASFTMTVTIFASITSASETAPGTNNVNGTNDGLCPTGPLSPVRVCSSAPLAAIVNTADVTVGAGDLAGVPAQPTQIPGTVAVLTTQVTPAIAVSVDPSSNPASRGITVGTDGDPSMDFTIHLTRPSDGNVKVNYTTSNGTATAGTDYTTATGSVTFAPGETLKVVTVPLVDSGAGVNPVRNFNFTLSSPVVTGSSSSDPAVIANQGTGSIQPDAGD